jgi:hypothetical protein
MFTQRLTSCCSQGAGHPLRCTPFLSEYFMLHCQVRSTPLSFPIFGQSPPSSRAHNGGLSGEALAIVSVSLTFTTVAAAARPP